MVFKLGNKILMGSFKSKSHHPDNIFPRGIMYIRQHVLNHPMLHKSLLDNQQCSSKNCAGNIFL